MTIQQVREQINSIIRQNGRGSITAIKLRDILNGIADNLGEGGGSSSGDGAQGPQGLKGRDGAPGLTGMDGSQGKQGRSGSNGTDGAQGRQGKSGRDGDDGIPGKQGSQGNAGADGEGSQGPVGRQGPMGVGGGSGTGDGSQGPIGQQGPVGISATGTQGPMGPAGSGNGSGEGTQGTQGSRGSQGRQGKAGADADQSVINNLLNRVAQLEAIVAEYMEPSDGGESGGEEILPDLDYDLADGDLRVYEDGSYYLTESKETGQLLNVAENKSFTLNMDGNTYELENVEYDIDGQITVEKHYALITASLIDKPGEHVLMVNYDDGSQAPAPAKLSVYDSRINVVFNTHQLTIDRSRPGSLMTQFPNGIELKDYLTITTEGDSSENFRESYIRLYIDGYMAGQSVYNGNAVKIINSYGWYFDDSTWVDGAQDTLYVAYGDHETDSMMVSVITSNANKIYIRGTNHLKTKLVVGETYTLRDLIKFYPDDCNFSYLQLEHFSFTGDSEYLNITKSNTTPTSWDEFYDNYITVTPIQAGSQKRYNYTWRSDESGVGGGKSVYITIVNQ